MRLCFAKQNQVRWVFACLGVVLYLDSGEVNDAGGNIYSRYPTMPTGSPRSKARTAQRWGDGMETRIDDETAKKKHESCTRSASCG